MMPRGSLCKRGPVLRGRVNKKASIALAPTDPSLYIVHMKRLSAAAARQRFSDLLDAAERGEGIVIERRGVQFELVTRKPARHKARRRSLIEWVDPAVDAGQWTWQAGPDGLEFAPRRGGEGFCSIRMHSYGCTSDIEERVR